MLGGALKRFSSLSRASLGAHNHKRMVVQRDLPDVLELIFMFGPWRPASKHKVSQPGYPTRKKMGANIMARPSFHSSAGGAFHG